MPKSFFKIIELKLKKINRYENKKITLVAKIFYETYKNNGIIYIFGTGHSHMLAEDAHFRAGGFAPICPILSKEIMIHESASKSSITERTKGVASKILKKYKLSSKDIVVIFSNSGVNQAPIEAAQYAKSKNCKVIGICSFDYSKVAPLSKLKKRLTDISDICINNYGPPGDALVKIKNGIKVSAFSTIAGSYILNSIISKTAKLAKNENPFPFYISSNMPNSKKHNNMLFKKYKKRNPHL